MHDVSSPRGETFEPARDGKRLAAQRNRILAAIADGDWVTLGYLAAICGDPEASCSARLRDLRREGKIIERRYVRRGLHEYRLVKRDLFEGLQ